MSSTSSGGRTARQDIARYLNKNSGWHEVSDIRVATGYSHGHVLSTCKQLMRDSSSQVEGRKNHSKPVIGYWINGNFVVPGSDRQRVIRVIRQYGNVSRTLGTMSLDQLYSLLRSIASSAVTIEHKWEFRIP